MARLAARIHDNGSRLTELAEAAGVTKQTAYILVEQLVAAGYVRRTPDPTDRRARLIRIEPRGRRVQKVARQVEAEVLQEWQAHLGARDLERLTDALTRLREITDLAP
jgi:DNA-binding MarR family transcriptional regulator